MTARPIHETTVGVSNKPVINGFTSVLLGLLVKTSVCLWCPTGADRREERGYEPYLVSNKLLPIY